MNSSIQTRILFVCARPDVCTVIVHLIEMEAENVISRETGQKLLESWSDRAFNQGVQVQILKTVAFLNDFDTNVRSRLSELDRKLIFLTKRIAFLESAVVDEDAG